MTTSTTITAPTVVKTKLRRRINWQKQAVAYIFLLPALLVFTLVTWYPILNTILYSFQKSQSRRCSRLGGVLKLCPHVWESCFLYGLGKYPGLCIIEPGHGSNGADCTGTHH